MADFKLSKDFKKFDIPSFTDNIATTEEWNNRVIESSAISGEKLSSSPFNPTDIVQRQTVSEKAKLKAEEGINNSGFIDSASAMFESFKKTNDFVAIYDIVNKPDFKQDSNWINSSQEPDFLFSVMDANRIPHDYADRLREAKSAEEFSYISEVIKKEMAVNDRVSNTIGTGLQVTSAFGGALTGLDLPLLFLPEVGLARFAKKLHDIENMSSIRLADEIDRLSAFKASGFADDANRAKSILTAANISLTAAVSVAQTSIHDHMDAMDGAISFLALAGINHWLIGKNFGKLDVSSLDNRLRDLRAYSVLEKLNNQLLIPYKPDAIKYLKAPIRPTFEAKIYEQGLLPSPFKKGDDVIPDGVYSTGKGTIISPEVPKWSSDLIKGNVGKINESILSLEKEVQSLTKRIANKGIGKDLKLSAETKLLKATSDLKTLKTGLVAVRKAKTFEKKMQSIAKLTKLYNVDNTITLMAGEISPVIDDAVEAISRHVDDADLKEIGDAIISSSKGERLAIKEVGGKNVVGKVSKDGKFIKFAKQHKYLTAMAITAMAGTSAQAFEGGSQSGESDYKDYIVYGLIGILAGSVAFKKIQNIMSSKTGYKSVAGGAMQSILTTFMSSELKTTPTGQKMGKLYSAMNKSLIAIGYPFRDLFYNGDDAGKKLAKDLLYDPENVGLSVAETRKMNKVNQNLSSFYPVYSSAFKRYSKEKVNNFKNAGDRIRFHNQIHRDFNIDITKSILSKSYQGSKEAREVAEHLRKSFSDIGTRAVQAGVAGFRKLEDTYFPRLTRFKEVFDTVRVLDGGKFEKGGKVYDELRENYIRMYSSMHPSQSADDVYKNVDEIMNSFIDVSNHNIRGGAGDILGSPTARALERIPLDLSEWKDISITINGVSKKISLEEIFNLDAEGVYKSYMNSMEGHIALAEKGYKSYTDALNIAGQQSGDLARTATIAINNIIGVQNYDSMTTLAQSASLISNMTMPIQMSLSAIMQIKEAGSTFIRASRSFSSFKVLVDEFVNVLRNRGSDDAVTALAMELDGRGKSIIGNKLHTRSFDDTTDALFANDETVISIMNKTGMSVRDVSMMIYGIAPITDWMQRVNARMNLDLIAKVSHGKAKFSKREIEVYGITDEMLDLVRSNTKLNSKGNLTAESAKAIDGNAKLFEPIQNTVFNMGQSQMLTPMIGTTPTMFKESALGAASGNLLSFAFNAYATYGINTVKGLSRVDTAGHAMLDSMLWFSSMFIAQKLKDSIKGKERDDEEVVRYALMQMPLSAPLALPMILGGSDIASSTSDELISHTQDMANLLENFRE